MNNQLHTCSHTHHSLLELKHKILAVTGKKQAMHCQMHEPIRRSRTKFHASVWECFKDASVQSSGSRTRVVSVLLKSDTCSRCMPIFKVVESAVE